MVIIYQEQEIIKHVKHIHASSTKINGEEKKKIEYLLHECALLMKEYFSIQRGGSKSVLNFERQPLFIEVGML